MPGDKHHVAEQCLTLQEKAKLEVLLESEKAARQLAETTAADLQVQLQNATSKAFMAEQVLSTLSKNSTLCMCVLLDPHACSPLW